MQVDPDRRSPALVAVMESWPPSSVSTSATGSRMNAYEERRKAAYHPELFDRLDGDWLTPERSQRPRGVLRLMVDTVLENANVLKINAAQFEEEQCSRSAVATPTPAAAATRVASARAGAPGCAR